jgi:hypothetical protein
VDKLPFSVYDFFGYLSAGFLTMVAVATAFVGEGPLHFRPGLVTGIFLLVFAYVVGQVIGNLAGFLLEGLLVGRAIRRPTPHLFGNQNDGWRQRWFPGYCRSLPAATQDRVRERARGLGVVDPQADWALFMHCHARVKGEPVTQERLETFLNLYGFCRNCALALLAGGCVLVAGSLNGSAETGVVSPGWWSAAAIACAVGLFYRYLKFFRHYAVEVFASYAEGD